VFQVFGNCFLSFSVKVFFFFFFLLESSVKFEDSMFLSTFQVGEHHDITNFFHDIFRLFSLNQLKLVQLLEV
jgi:hypothetical protein